MWKCVSRSVKTFRKTVLKKSTVLSTKPVQNEELYCILKFTPSVLNRFNLFSNICPFSYEFFSNEKKDKEGQKEKKTKFLSGFKEYVVDALKWSGVIMFVGYYQVYYKQRSIFIISDPSKEAFPRITGYYRALEYLIDSLTVTPYHCVFPEIQAVRVRKDKKEFEAESEIDKNVNHEENFSVLDEAHQKVSGELNNFLGIHFMKSGNEKEALKYFLQSAEEEHPSGIFNLGLCHEKGYGTIQNFSRAAELYQRASDLGHATAMYNLGVFYAQGRGGIALDLDHARNLFKAAALLGQLDAEKALRSEKKSMKELPDNVIHPKNEEKEKSILNLTQLTFNKVLGNSSCQQERDYSVCNNNNETECESISYVKIKELNSSLGSDSGVLDLSPHNDPYAHSIVLI